MSASSPFALHVHRFGDGPLPILALHGFTGSGADFVSLAEHLSDTTFTAPDLLGHGFSPAPEDPAHYAMPPTCSRLQALLDSSFDAMPVVLGYSMGGRCALHLLTQCATDARALILVGTNPGLESQQAREARQTQDRRLAEQITRDGSIAFATFWEAHPMIRSQSRIASPLREAMQARRRGASAQGLSASLRGRGTGHMTPLWKALAQLHCPTLLLTGEEDKKYAGIADDMATLLPNAQHIRVAHAGHCCHLEQPQATAAIIRTFLADQGITAPRPPSQL